MLVRLGFCGNKLWFPTPSSVTELRQNRTKTKNEERISQQPSSSIAHTYLHVCMVKRNAIKIDQSSFTMALNAVRGAGTRVERGGSRGGGGDEH